ncbi:hypothetical protein ACVBGC_25970 [Burkholderia stagnalis]
MKLQAEAIVTFIAIMVAELLSMLVMLIIPRSYSPFELASLAAFGLVTTVLFFIWLRADIERAYLFAVKHDYLRFAGQPPRIVAIVDSCPRRWMVMLHIRMHPALVGVE